MKVRRKLRIHIRYFDQCDKKKCSSVRLYRLFQRGNFPNLYVLMDRKPFFRELVLDPRSSIVLTPQDRRIVVRRGIGIIDCSWKQFNSINVVKDAEGRYLPYLLAANSVNYGKPYRLSSAEAIIATLYIVGFKDEAWEIDEKFPGKFILLNEAPLEEYSRCQTQEDVLKVAREYMPKRANEERIYNF